MITVDTSDFDGQTELSKTKDAEGFMALSSLGDSQDSAELSEEVEYPDDVDATASASIVVDGNGRYGRLVCRRQYCPF